MRRTRTIIHEGAEKAMTLDELASFVQDALRSGADGSELAKVRINYGGTIKKIEVEVHIVADAVPGHGKPA
jgi:hypothetical protein